MSLFRLTLPLLLCGILAQFGVGQSWNLASDWSEASNPNGAWSLQAGDVVLPHHYPDWANVTGQPAFGPAEGSGIDPAFMKVTTNLVGDTDDAFVGDIVTHTKDGNGGSNGPANLVWTCPTTGRYSITGNVWQARRSLGRTNNWSFYLKGSLYSSGAIDYGHSRSDPIVITSSLDGPTIQVDFHAGQQVNLVLEKTSLYGDFVGVRLQISRIGLIKVKVLPTSVTGGSGTAVLGTVTLASPAPAGGTQIALLSADPSRASVPSSVTVAEGTTSATFAVTHYSVSTPFSVNIQAKDGSITKSANLDLVPPKAKSLKISPGTVRGGSAKVVTGTVTINAPAPVGGTVVTLSSDNPSAADVPPSVTVPSGSTSVTFTVTHHTVGALTVVTISATANGVTKTRTLTINP